MRLSEAVKKQMNEVTELAEVMKLYLRLGFAGDGMKH